MNQKILIQDISDFVDRCSYWEKFKNKRIAVTGATGLIGSITVKCLVALNEKYDLGMTVYCVVRNTLKANQLLKILSPSVVIVSFNDFATIGTSVIDDRIDFIIHAAAPTASAYFTNKPVETYDGVVGLTRFILEKAKVVSYDYLLANSSSVLACNFIPHKN